MSQVDSQGVHRGACSAEDCPCQNYVCSRYSRCDYCDHAAVIHIALAAAPAVEKSVAGNPAQSLVANSFQQFPQSYVQNGAETQQLPMPGADCGFVQVVPAVFVDPEDLADPAEVRLPDGRSSRRGLMWVGFVFVFAAAVVLLVGIALLFTDVIDVVLFWLCFALLAVIYGPLGAMFIFIGTRVYPVAVTFSRSSRTMSYVPEHYRLFSRNPLIAISYDDIQDFSLTESCVAQNHRTILYININLKNGDTKYLRVVSDYCHGENLISRMNRLVRLR